MLPEKGDFGMDIPVRVGIVCDKKYGDKGIVSFEECLECPGVRTHLGRFVRCYPRQFLLKFLEKESSDYYTPRWGIYHVNDVNMCGTAFLLSRMIGKVYTPMSMWNMRFGTEIHGFYNTFEISNPDIEQKVECNFERDGRKISLVGSQDAFFGKFSMDKFSDIRQTIKEDEVLNYYFRSILDVDGCINGVLGERKSIGSFDSVFSGPRDYHLDQTRKYIGLREKQDVSALLFTYLGKKEGREINHIIPIIYENTDLYRDVGEEVLDRSLSVNTDKIRKICMDKAETFERCLLEGALPYRMPAFKQECSWCAFNSACKFSSNSPINDNDKLMSTLRTWEKMLRLSDRFISQPTNFKDILDRWK